MSRRESMKTAEDRITEALQYMCNHGGGSAGELKSALLDILRPAPQRHTLGGVVFEETGEVRVPDAGDWYMGSGGGFVCCAESDWDRTGKNAILRPVEIEGAE